ncbi:MAG TPA: 30S ribosomal protein S11 [Candidatus Paceibacterota bacterium]
MGKKRIVTTEGKEAEGTEAAKSVSKTARKRFSNGVLHIQSTYNNTKVLLADEKGNGLAWSSSGSLGFRGAKKGTPFAASKVGELLAEKATVFGIKEVSVMINGVGAGRESALRAFAGKGIGVTSISDITPVPHNGPRAPRARRV